MASEVEMRACKLNKVPGEEAFVKGYYIKLWVWHDACIQVEVVQPVIPAVDIQSHTYCIQFSNTVVPNLFLEDLKILSLHLSYSHIEWQKLDHYLFSDLFQRLV